MGAISRFYVVTIIDILSFTTNLQTVDWSLLIFVTQSGSSINGTEHAICTVQDCNSFVKSI